MARRISSEDDLAAGEMSSTCYLCMEMVAVTVEGMDRTGWRAFCGVCVAEPVGPAVR